METLGNGDMLRRKVEECERIFREKNLFCEENPEETDTEVVGFLIKGRAKQKDLQRIKGAVKAFGATDTTIRMINLEG